jgi:hypothetical protein
MAKNLLERLAAELRKENNKRIGHGPRTKKFASKGKKKK